MDIKLGDAEFKVMNALWREGDTTAKRIADVCGQENGWTMNTTYTLIKRCIKKGAIARSEPNFMCHALVTREEAQKAEITRLVDKVFDSSVNNLLAAMLHRESISDEQIERLKRIVDDRE